MYVPCKNGVYTLHIIETVLLPSCTFFLMVFVLVQALLDYERHKTCSGELNIPIASQSEPINVDNQVI